MWPQGKISTKWTTIFLLKQGHWASEACFYELLRGKIRKYSNKSDTLPLWNFLSVSKKTCFLSGTGPCLVIQSNHLRKALQKVICNTFVMASFDGLSQRPSDAHQMSRLFQKNNERHEAADIMFNLWQADNNTDDCLCLVLSRVHRFPIPQLYADFKGEVEKFLSIFFSFFFKDYF